MLLAHLLPKLPTFGSARESVLIEYFLRKDEIEYARDLAQAQLGLDPKKGIERFVDFQKTIFPWMETAQKREKESHANVLKKFVNAGALVVSQSMTPGKGTPTPGAGKNNQVISRMKRSK